MILVRNAAAVALAGATVWAAAACSSSAPPPATGAVSPATTAPAQGTSPAATAPAGGASPAATASAGSAGTSGNAAAAAISSGCTNAPATLVGTDLKLPVGKLTAIVEGPVTVCAYAGRYEVIVRYQTGENTSEFAQARQSQAGLHQAVGTVNGLGEAAYLASYTATKPVSNTLGALKGNVAVFITSPAPLGAEIALMTDLLKKI